MTMLRVNQVFYLLESNQWNVSANRETVGFKKNSLKFNGSLNQRQKMP